MRKVYTSTISEHEYQLLELIEDYDGRADWFYSENAIQNYETLESVPATCKTISLVTSEDGTPLFYSVIIKR